MLDSVVIGVLIGVSSSFIMYCIRQKRRADSLRQVIATEIRNTPVGAFKATHLGVNALETPITDANLGNLDLLSQREVELVAQYHRHMAKVRDVNERESRDDSIRIPVRLVMKGDKLSSETANTLETSRWRLTTLSWLRSVFSREGEEESEGEDFDEDEFAKRAWELQQEVANQDLDEEEFGSEGKD